MPDDAALGVPGDPPAETVDLHVVARPAQQEQVRGLMPATRNDVVDLEAEGGRRTVHAPAVAVIARPHPSAHGGWDLFGLHIDAGEVEGEDSALGGEAANDLRAGT